MTDGRTPRAPPLQEEAMRRKKVTEITVETRQITIIRRRQKTVCVWCAACAEEVEMVTPEQVAEVTGLSMRAIYQQVEQGRFHFIETAEGQMRLGLNSVRKTAPS
jgi:predicted DNA-binding transcriptional regulator AlpA